jgi:hypothetical protein
MKMLRKIKGTDTDRRNERGAALISTLLLAMLLLTAGGALVLTTTMSATNAIDSTAEMQAYYGAEAGLQSTINVLRGNVWTGNATPNVNFRTAVEPNTSNAANDPATNQNVARLSNWLDYSSTTAYPTRVTANGQTGVNTIAYDVMARDIDNSKVVSYSTSAAMDANDSGCVAVGTTIVCTGGLLSAFTLTYTPQAATTLTAYPAAASNLGSFRLTVVGNGANIPAGNSATFRLRINQTLPWAAYDTVLATISGNVTAANSNLRVTFSGSTAKVDGTSYVLDATNNPLDIKHPTAAGGGVTALSSTITAPEPRRILVRSTGYGPKGAVKKLEMVLNQSVFDFEAPAVLTVRGADDGTPMAFDTGSSGAKNYSGIDHSGTQTQLPTFAVLGSDLTEANDGIKKHGTIEDPELAYLDIGTVPAGTTVPALQVGTPDFLQTADKARGALNALETTANNMGRYQKPAVGSAYTVTAANTTPTGITFVDGDCNLEGGSGLLVVTGNLEMSGNPNFEGVILVLGQGSVNRDGGGNGNVYGAMVVAAFNRQNGNFTAPSFNTNGGGNSTMQYDSLAVARALGAIGVAPGGIREF